MPSPRLWSKPLAATQWLGSAFWSALLNGIRASASPGTTSPAIRRSQTESPICVPKDRVDLLCIMYANLKKGLVVGLVAGLVAAALVFGLCLLASTWPAVTNVSLTWSFRPWWRSSNWLAALASFFFVTVVVGVLAAFRLRVRRKR